MKWFWNIFMAALVMISGFFSLFYLNQAQPTAQASAETVYTFTNPNGAPDITSIYNSVNTLRAANGLPALKPNAQLAELAQARAEDMATHGYYAHKDSAGMYFDEKLALNGYGINYGCENLGLEFNINSQLFVQAWLNSNAGHKQCMLHPTATSAGYAAITIAPKTAADHAQYIVVAIHATTPEKL